MTSRSVSAPRSVSASAATLPGGLPTRRRTPETKVEPVSFSRSDRPAGPTGLAPHGRPRRRARLAAAIIPLLTLCACGFGAPPGATTQGQSIAHLWRVLWYFALPVGLI